MQKKTSSKEFLKYGNVYDAPIDAERNNMTSTIFSIQAKNSISQLHCFDCPVYIEMQSGMSCILIGTQPGNLLRRAYDPAERKPRNTA